MKAGYGKQKGSEFERKVCKSLSLWATNGKRDDIFWRSAMSGGRASVMFKKGKKNKSQVGDISAVDKIGAPFIEKYAVECKNYRKIGIDSCVYGTISKTENIMKWWKEISSSSEKAKKVPLLIVKQSGNIPLIFMLWGTWADEIVETNLKIQPMVEFTRMGIVAFEFDVFLKEVDYKSFCRKQ